VRAASIDRSAPSWADAFNFGAMLSSFDGWCGDAVAWIRSGTVELASRISLVGDYVSQLTALSRAHLVVRSLVRIDCQVEQSQIEQYLHFRRRPKPGV
jgi:hypothetical protein